jgi:hypothetical protein
MRPTQYHQVTEIKSGYDEQDIVLKRTECVIMAGKTKESGIKG